MNNYCKTFLIILIVTVFSTGYSQPTPPEGMTWKVVEGLTDEFDNYDTNKWFKPLWNYGEPVQMKANNSGVENGNLWIKATLDDGAVRWFETSRVMSKTFIKFPMYTECRMKTAHISAYNTFWLNDGDAFNRDEIDVVELNSKPSAARSQYDSWPYLMQSQYFIVINNNTERAKGDFDNRNLSLDNPLRGVPWNEQYHTVGVWWKDKNNVQFYLDGEPAGSVTTNRDFTREQRVIWDLWTIDQPNWSGGIATKSDLSDNSINTMYVDWIHTFTLEASLSSSNKEKVETIKIFPNPVSDVINISLLNRLDSKAQVEIFDNLGTLVKKAYLKSTENQVSISTLSSGIYYAKISNGTQVEFKPLIKK